MSRYRRASTTTWWSAFDGNETLGVSLRVREVAERATDPDEDAAVRSLGRRGDGPHRVSEELRTTSDRDGLAAAGRSPCCRRPTSSSEAERCTPSTASVATGKAAPAASPTPTPQVRPDPAARTRWRRRWRSRAVEDVDAFLSIVRSAWAHSALTAERRDGAAELADDRQRTLTSTRRAITDGLAVAGGLAERSAAARHAGLAPPDSTTGRSMH